MSRSVHVYSGSRATRVEVVIATVMVVWVRSKRKMLYLSCTLQSQKISDMEHSLPVAYLCYSRDLAQRPRLGDRDCKIGSELRSWSIVAQSALHAVTGIIAIADRCFDFDQGYRAIKHGQLLRQSYQSKANSRASSTNPNIASEHQILRLHLIFIHSFIHSFIHPLNHVRAPHEPRHRKT